MITARILFVSCTSVEDLVRVETARFRVPDRYRPSPEDDAGEMDRAFLRLGA